MVWLYVFYRLDHYEPEPAALLARTFLVGALALGPALVLEVAGIRALLGPETSRHLQDLPDAARALALFAVVAPLEEGLKFLAAWLSIGRHEEYDEPIDGVIYMVAAALGFSTAENLYYILRLDPKLLALRGIFSCFLHASCSGLVGFWWSETKLHGRSRAVLVSALCGASIIHGLFDVVAFSEYTNTFFLLAVFLVALDLALTYRIKQAQDRSPFRPGAEREHEGVAAEPGPAGSPPSPSRGDSAPPPPPVGDL